jgi:hypothetical protein
MDKDLDSKLADLFVVGTLRLVAFTAGVGVAILECVERLLNEWREEAQR